MAGRSSCRRSKQGKWPDDHPVDDDDRANGNQIILLLRNNRANGNQINLEKEKYGWIIVATK